jgi:hypothetical protein
MADFVTPFWNSLRAAIGVGAPLVLTSASPDGGGIWRVVSIEKVDWEAVTVPYCAVAMRMLLDPDAAITTDSYIVVTDIYYIVADSITVAETIDAVLMAIKDAIKAYDFTTVATFLDVLEFDSSETNRANQALLARNEALSAGMLSVQFRIGETAN